MFLINFTKVARIIDSMDGHTGCMKNVERELSDILVILKTLTNLDEEILRLSKATDAVQRECRSCGRLAQALEGIAGRYLQCEQWLANEAERANVQYPQKIVRVASTARLQNILKQIL